MDCKNSVVYLNGKFINDSLLSKSSDQNSNTDRSRIREKDKRADAINFFHNQYV
jgi:hypothetical protein